ncbi:hypothetical protein OPKNFCMD_1829 [Methylobacterium crusticola]|uniref:Uncharacterized protein n=1 Tax=Methylobacterium crusticola TaxID=1697972 RepID=A0ABQ4QWP6_9HYPH|nr:hypothetical protein [Methylobacterium crusticola]GJD49099.1 hypothetical protein OPKNFCMD_1829 [Methylobacterium crusticola]
MILAACEGLHWQYEIVEHADGYVVQMRDLDTGDLDADFVTVFRTMPVAFAYAEMSAAFDRFAASDDEEADDAESASDFATSERSFADLSSRLCDGGVAGNIVQAWERRRDGEPRRGLH